MAFLNKSMLAKKAGDATVKTHPMLEAQEVPLNVKQLYLQGCILAAVLECGNLTSAKRTAIVRLATSLRLPDGDVQDGVAIVTGLSSDEEKEQFVAELFSVLGGEFYPQYFMKDFEELVKVNGRVSKEMAEYVDYFGSSLFRNSDWRNAQAVHAQTKSAATGTSKNVVDSDSRGTSGSGSSQSRSRSLKHSTGQTSGSQFDSSWSGGATDQSGAYYIDSDRCIECGCCHDVCPAEAVIYGGDHFFIDHGKCVECGACAAACLNEAIQCGAVTGTAADNGGSFDYGTNDSYSDYASSCNYSDPLLGRVRDIVVDQLGVNAQLVVPTASFKDDLGADSLDAVELVMALEEEFGMAIPEGDAEKITTVGRAIDYLHSKGF